MDPVVGAIGGAVVAALGAYIVQLRRLSGQINTSEAAELWKESSSIRDDYARRIAHSEERQADLEKRVADLERDNNILRKENLELRERNLDCERELAKLKERCDGLAKENEHLRTTIRRFGGLTSEP